MIIRGMRWGYDGGGIACGPVEGNTVVEICVTNANKHNFFVVVTRMSEYENVYISPVPLFDLLMESIHFDVDYDAEYDKITSLVIEEYSYEISDEPREMGKSDFVKVIILARLAMQNIYGNDNPETNYITAQKYIMEYIGKDIDVTR